MGAVPTAWRTASSVTLVGTGSAWIPSGPDLASDIATSDDVKCSSTISAGGKSQKLSCTGFGFSIPDRAELLGYELAVERMASAAGIRDLMIQLQHGGVTVGSGKQDNLTDWPLADETRYYGGKDDLWGTSLTPAQVRDSTFGVRVGAKSITFPSSLTAYVDLVQLRVWYLLAPVVYRTHTAPGYVRWYVALPASGQVDIPIDDLAGRHVASVDIDFESVAGVLGVEIADAYGQDVLGLAVTGLSSSTTVAPFRGTAGSGTHEKYRIPAGARLRVIGTAGDTAWVALRLAQ